MGEREQIWESLDDEEYRRAYADEVGTTLALQIRMLRERRALTQQQLADLIGKRQETISQWENPDYGRYTLSTLRSLAEAFDVAPVFRLGSFSELVDWVADLSPDKLAPPSFKEDRTARQQTADLVARFTSTAAIFGETGLGASPWLGQELTQGFLTGTPTATVESESVLSAATTVVPAKTEKEGEHGLAA